MSDNTLIFWTVLIIWCICFLFWITSDVWQRCFNLSHNYNELHNLDDEDFPLDSIVSSDESEEDSDRRGREVV